MTLLKIGDQVVPADSARDLVISHVLNPRAAYPAYDSYPGSADPFTLAEQDLLAPALLNAGRNAIDSYYTLLRHRTEINAVLGQLKERLLEQSPKAPELVSLAEASTGVLNMVGKLFELQEQLSEWPYARLTVFSKTLHRKLPHLLPLWDRNINHVYEKFFEDAGIHRNAPRSQWFPLWLTHVRETLRRYRTHWEELRQIPQLLDAAQRAQYQSTRYALHGIELGAVSQLRALDMVTWQLGAVRPSQGSAHHPHTQ